MYEYRGKVIRVVDGDTVVVNVDLGFKICSKIMVRLKQIDTPEIYSPKTPEELVRGRKAKNFVEDMVLNKAIILKTYKDRTGKYGRYLADIMYTAEDNTLHLLSDALKEAGLEKRVYVE